MKATISYSLIQHAFDGQECRAHLVADGGQIVVIARASSFEEAKRKAIEVFNVRRAELPADEELDL